MTSKSDPQALVVIGRPPVAVADPLARLDDLLRLNVAGGDASLQTLRSYATHIGQFVDWCAEEGVDPVRATYHDMLLYRRFLVECDYTRATIGVKLSAVSAIFRALVRAGHRADNPVDGIKPPRQTTSTRDRILAQLYTAEEIAQILAVIPKDTPAGLRDAAMVWLGYGHGMRVSEVVGLDLGNLHMAALPPSLDIIAGKGRKDRVIYLVDRSIIHLEAWLACRRGIVENPDSGPLFVCLSRRKRGHRLTTSGARYCLNLHAKAASLYRPGRSFHGLRHGHATEATRRGIPLRVLADEMGHASLDTTRQYVHVADALDENPAMVLDDV